MEIKTAYAVKHKNEDIRAASRSGGVFTALSDYVLEQGGIVYGCAMKDPFTAEHRRASTREERDAFRGSKYIQSNINNCYSLCKQDLKNGLLVLFSGTPCQIEALNNYLTLNRINTNKLITIDILCHGVPSPMVWKDYLNEYFPDSNIQSVDFRDKKNFGWRAHWETVTVNGAENSNRVFTDLFYSHIILRPSCFECSYKRKARISDITIGDYWLIELNQKEFDDDKGVSLVLTNNEKGEQFFGKCCDDLEIKQFPLATSIQTALDHNYSIPEKRQKFWKDYDNYSISELTKLYLD